LFCGAILVLLPPFISIYDKADFIFGVPQAFIVIYGIWAFIILAIALGARRRSMRKTPAETALSPISDKGDS